MSTTRAPQESGSTPPSSIGQTPLTPPPSEQKSGTVTVVEDIVREIENRKSGSGDPVKPWLRYSLSPIAYQHLKERLQTDSSAEDKLRSDYFPSANLFVLRMPSLLHETITSSIVEEILQQLRSRASEVSPAAEFIRSIKHCGSASIKFDDLEFGSHDPDASFKHLDAQYPGVVIEVSYSQKRSDLARLADDYILGSDGSIRLVIGIDIDYKDKSASLSMWQPRFQDNDAGEQEFVAHQTLSNQEFRNVKGIPNSDPQTGLRIRLEDFATQQLIPKPTTLGKDIFISSARLCGYLCDAELSESRSKHNKGVTETLPSGVKKRRRPSTPIEQLNTDDEHRFREDEERAVKRSQRNDLTY